MATVAPRSAQGINPGISAPGLAQLRVQPEWRWDEVEDPTTAYAREVVAGGIIAGRLVRLACERHLRDLEEGPKRGLWFDLEAARQVMVFASFMVQSKGDEGGQRLKLQAWQCFRLGSVFGWKRWVPGVHLPGTQEVSEGRWVRRFNTAYNEVARKNGKTTESATVGLWGLTRDGEKGAEIYVAATKRAQARKCWDEAWYMAGHANSPAKWRAGIIRYPEKEAAGPTAMCSLFHPGTGSRFEPLGADERSTDDGLNIHFAIFDEMHAWVHRGMFEVLTTASGARSQPLIWIITTAGASLEGIGFEQHQYALDVIEGRTEDDSWFVYIATLDHPERWDDPIEWAKANPGLGVTVFPRALEQLCKKAKVVPADKLTFLRLYLNVWIQQKSAAWMSVGVFDEQPMSCPLPRAETRDPRPEAFGGLVVAAPQDLAAFALWFPDVVDEQVTEVEGRSARVRRIPRSGQVLWRIWIPSDSLERRKGRAGGTPLAEWGEGRRAEGEEDQEPWVIVQEGETLDYDAVYDEIVALGERYNVSSIGRAPFNSAQIGRQLAGAGFVDVEIPQSVLRLAEPTRAVEKMLLDRELRHEGNPVARWMFENAVVRTDPQGNIRLDPMNSGDNISAWQALVMAVSEGMMPAAAKEPEARLILL